MSGRVTTSLWQSAKVTFRVLWRVTKQLFHETTGALFGLFAAYGAFVAWRQWQRKPVLWIMAIAIAYSITMGIFAIGSFLRARRVR